MRPEQIDKLIKRLEAQPSGRLDERIDSLLDSRRQVVAPCVRRRTVRSRLAGAAIAAVVLFAVLIGVPLFNGDGNNVWARALENTRKIGDYSFRRVGIHKAGDSEQSPVILMTTDFYHVSVEQGVRIEHHSNGQDDPDYTLYMLYDSNEVIKIYPANEYERWPGVWLRMEAPREMALWLLQGDYTQLGTKTVDGRVLIGIGKLWESNVPAEGDDAVDWRHEAWFDRETQLPAVMESVGRLRSTGMCQEIRQDEFRYDVEFPPDFFKPVISEDSTPVGINGLRLFAELTGGEYPQYLDRDTVRRKIGDRDQVEEAIRAKSPPSGKYGYGAIERATTFFASVRGRGDFAYYGDRVTARDADRVLMYWGAPPRPYDVVWGDLRVETLSKDQLIESCHAAGDSRCLLGLLEKEQGERVPLLAAYLGETGDSSAVPSLLRLADENQHLPTADVFRNAIEAIRRREEQRNPSSALVAGRLFYANGRSVSHGCVQIGTTRVLADREGYFVMTTPVVDPRVEQIGYAYRSSGSNARLFRWARAGAPASLAIILDWTCTVEGRVVNQAGEPLSGVDVGLCPQPGEKAGRNWPDGSRATTDAQGHFLFEDVPVGLPLNLVVQNPNGAEASLRVQIEDLAADQNRDLGDIAISVPGK